MSQDFHAFLERYRAEHADDVLVVEDEVSPDQDVTAVIWTLAAQGRDPLLVFERMGATKVVTNIFASRRRIARLLGCDVSSIHRTYQERARKAVDPKVVAKGPVLDSVEEKVDLTKLPLLRHFETDKAAYITNAAVVAEGSSPWTGNLSYHRACALEDRARPTAFARSPVAPAAARAGEEEAASDRDGDRRTSVLHDSDSARVGSRG